MLENTDTPKNVDINTKEAATNKMEDKHGDENFQIVRKKCRYLMGAFANTETSANFCIPRMYVRIILDI